MRQTVDQIFIRVRIDEDRYYDKDISKATYEQRMKHYETLSKGQIIYLLEQIQVRGIKFKK